MQLQLILEWQGLGKVKATLHLNRGLCHDQAVFFILWSSLYLSCVLLRTGHMTGPISFLGSSKTLFLALSHFRAITIFDNRQLHNTD